MKITVLQVFERLLLGRLQLSQVQACILENGCISRGIVSGWVIPAEWSACTQMVSCQSVIKQPKADAWQKYLAVSGYQEDALTLMYEQQQRVICLKMPQPLQLVRPCKLSMCFEHAEDLAKSKCSLLI